MRRTMVLLSLTLADAGTYREALAAGTSREELERDGVVHSALDPDPDPSCTRLSGVGGAVHDESSFQVAAYLPEWRYEGANWATICATVTHLILFSIEVAPTGALAALDRLPRPELMLEVRHINDTRHSPMHLKTDLKTVSLRRARRPRRAALSCSSASAATVGAQVSRRRWRARRSAHGAWRRCSIHPNSNPNP